MVKKTIKRFVNKILTGKRQHDGPLILTRGQHKIDIRLVSRHAVKVCEVLQHSGFQAYIVGGAVRDLLAGMAPKDFDVVTNATPEQIKPLFRRARIIGRRFRLVHVVFGREIIETSTFRTVSDKNTITDEHGRVLRDNMFGTHEEDAARRDFTFNALYYDPLTEQVIDYHNGVEDLNKRIVRMIGDPETRYREDPVRMLRALRFASKLDAEIEPKTMAPIKRMANLIKNVPSSRMVDELIKALTCGNGMDCLNAIIYVGMDQHVLPLIKEALSTNSGEEFIELSLSRTDHRIYTGKPVSPSYMFAALLWPLVTKKQQELISQGEHTVQALNSAADIVISRQMKILPLQKRILADMREIWFMQPRFEKVNARSIYRMLEQPRFRAAVDFLQMRAATKEVDSVQAQWWMDLANADDQSREDLIKSASPRRRNVRKRRRRRPRKRTVTTDQNSVD